MLVKPHELFERALRGEYALAAVAAHTLEIIQGSLWGARETSAPVILHVTEDTLQHFGGLKPFLGIARALAEDAECPVVLHLDRAEHDDFIRAWIDAGNSSVTIAAGTLPRAEHARRVREITQYAHERGVWVESALADLQAFTPAGELQEFAVETGIDALGVDLISVPGAFTGQEYIQFQVLESLGEALPHLPLSVQGVSGLAAGHLTGLAQTNVCKVVIDAETRFAYEEAVREYLASSPRPVRPGKLLEAAAEAVQRVVEHKTRLLGSLGQGTLNFV